MGEFVNAMGGFKTGDLVFVRYPPRGTQPIHVTVFLEPAFGLGSSYVHAGDGLEISPQTTYADYAPYGGYLHACTTDGELRAKVAKVAALFARSAKRTPYGDYPNKDDVARIAGGTVASPRANRFGGMIGTTNVDQIPFEFPALHRLLKWTYRATQKAALSENRGITCAAFSAVCHQVVGMLDFFELTGLVYDAARVRDCISQLDKLTVTKAELRKDLEPIGLDDKTGKTFYKGQALPANSNRRLSDDGKKKLGGMAMKKVDDKAVPRDWVVECEKTIGQAFTALSPVERAWLIVQHRYLEIPTDQVKLLSSIIDPDFFFDAKYVSSPALSKAMVDSKTWKATEYKTY